MEASELSTAGLLAGGSVGLGGSPTPGVPGLKTDGFGFQRFVSNRDSKDLAFTRGRMPP
jgi:hypothetical protein